jgi:hypothetical protein
MGHRKRKQQDDQTDGVIARVVIRDTVTGEARDIGWGVDAYYRFLWEEGNYGCDCNRGKFFYPEEWAAVVEAVGRKESKTDPRFSCGHARYRIDRIELIDGRVDSQDRWEER